MKNLLSAIALAALFTAPALPAHADGNGVERGDLSVHANDSIPKCVENKIETAMFEGCDLRGAERITTSYVAISHDEPSETNVYDIVYEVDFDGAAHPSISISVKAALHLKMAGDSAVELKGLDAPICRPLPAPLVPAPAAGSASLTLPR